MRALADRGSRVPGAGQILVLDDDLQTEARTLLAKSPQPQNEFEVAVILETLGHTDTTARSQGYLDLFDLARYLYARLDDFNAAEMDPLHLTEDPDKPDVTGVARSIAVFLGYSLPWLAAVFLFLVTGAGLWSSGAFTTNLASAMVLALVVGLVSSACFTFPFARRAFLYRVQGSRSLVSWTTRWILGVGVVACTVIAGLVYFLLEEVFSAYTPATNRVFLEMAVAISLFQLSLAPLYTLRSFGWLTAVVVAGIAAFAVGWAANGTDRTDPYPVVHIQLAALVTMVAVAGIGSYLLLRGRGESRAATPRLRPIVRSTAPYGGYGAGYFLLALVTQLIAGGIWHGLFRYSQAYGAVTGMALIALMPMLAYTTIAGDKFPNEAAALTGRVSVENADEASSCFVEKHYRRLATVVAVGLITSALMVLLVLMLRNDLRVAAIAWDHVLLFAVTLGAYTVLAVGVLNSQTLFALSRPFAPTVAVVGGSLSCLAVARMVELWWSAGAAASVSMLVGASVYGATTAVAALRTLRRYDRSTYAAL